MSDFVNDAELIRDALAGDNAAFGELVQKYHARLVQGLYQTCGNLAEDAAQKAWLLAWKQLGSFRFDSAFYTWLYRIAFNVGCEVRRRQSTDLVRPTGGEDDNLRQVPDDSDMQPDERVAKSELPFLVRNALEKLPEQQRIALVLQIFEGMKYEEIAELLEIKVSTVHTQLQNARENLKAKPELRRWFRCD